MIGIPSGWEEIAAWCCFYRNANAYSVSGFLSLFSMPGLHCGGHYLLQDRDWSIET